MGMFRQILLLIIINLTLQAQAVNLNALQVNSDKLDIDTATMTANFSGQVMICLEDMKLITNQAIFTFTKTKPHKLSSIYFPKTVVMSKGSEELTLLASCAEYLQEEAMLKLHGPIYLERHSNYSTSKELIYYGALQEVKLIPSSSN